MGRAAGGRDALERHQVWIYLAAVAVGLAIGSLSPDIGSLLEGAVWPVIAVLLFATFVQVPFATVVSAFADVRFVAAALIGNFVLIPLAVAALVAVAGVEGPIRLGLLLVLLVPCTDWFITFCQLARGDTARATAITPLNLLLQLALLPVYLVVFTGAEFASLFSLAEIWPALLVVLAPLAAAALVEVVARPARAPRIREAFAWVPVPALAVLLLLVAAAHVGAALDALDVLPLVVGVVAGLLAIALALAKIVATAVRLPAAQGRTLAFTFGTRNSFLVLPVALALPAGWEAAAVVIVMQSLVELLGMIFCVWFVPRVLFRERSEPVRS